MQNRHAGATHQPAGSSSGILRRHPPFGTVVDMELRFSGPLWFWRGPAPWHFVTVPEAECGLIAAASELVTYGWGMIPVEVQIGKTVFTTSLWPQGDGYIVPVKAAVRKAEKVELDDTVEVRLSVDV